MSAAGLSTGLAADRAATPRLLSMQATWWLLIGWALAFGLSTWLIEAILLRVVPGAPAEPLGGFFRLVESVLWIGAVAIAIVVAERWPIDDVATQWKRVLGQLGFGIALGPAWGTEAYRLSTVLMPAWHSRGMWGIIATESKGALYGYVTTAILVHVVLRTQRQRAREVAAADAVREAAEARLSVLKLELQPESVLRAMDAVEDLISRDVELANESLVVLSDALYEIAASARVQEVTLREEFAVTDIFVRLHALTNRMRIDLVSEADAEVTNAAVPHLLLHPLIESMLGHSSRANAQSVQIRLSARRAGELLTIWICATGFAADATAQGSRPRSLVYTQERLASLYGNSAQLSFGNAVNGEARLGVSIPLRLLPDAETANASLNGSVMR